jgi:hypothetical protein
MRHFAGQRVSTEKMVPYDDWNKLDEEEDEELQDNSVCPLSIVWWPTRLTTSPL